MQIDLEFTTPIFTANKLNNSKYVETSAILGGLRWWYEALIRGHGGFACEATNENGRCPQTKTPITPANVQEHLCPVCQLFGATGWRRRFDLVINFFHRLRFISQNRFTIANYFPYSHIKNLLLTFYFACD